MKSEENINIDNYRLIALKKKEVLSEAEEAELEHLELNDRLIKEEEKKLNKKKQFKDAFEHSFSEICAAETFIEKFPLFYDKSRIWWMWDDDIKHWEVVDEVDLMNSYYDVTGNSKVVNPRKRTEVMNALQMVARAKGPKEVKTKYIQFKDKVFNLETKEIHDVESRFFFTNPIPWELGTTSNTPTIDKLFGEWVGEDYIQTLHEIIAYCCYRDYPIQMLCCFYGGGRNGKSQFQKIMQKFIGSRNICSTELDVLLDNRFESFKLYKKLVCSLGETNFGVMKKTSLLKKLTGGDLIGFEKKNKDPFDDVNYAKILINSNSLPTSQDTSDGFHRRWLIIDFPNQFPEGKDIVATIPEEEYNNLAKKVVEILPELLKKGKFHKQGTIQERTKRYEDRSNPLPGFLNEFCERDADYFIGYNELYISYKLHLNKKRMRVVNRSEFKSCLELEGLFNTKCNKPTSQQDNYGSPVYKSGWYVEGIRLKQTLDF